jgi:hypothetical protein
MKLHWFFAALIILLSPGSGFPQGSADSYIAELGRLSAAVENSKTDSKAIKDILRRMPEEWDVRIENRTFRIHSAWLREGLNEILDKDPDHARRLLLARISLLRTESEAFQNQRQDMASSRKALSGILARREFGEVHSPTWIDGLKKRLLALIFRLLERIIGNSAFPVISRILIWILIGAAALTMVLWVLKSIRREAGLDLIALQSTSVSAKPWSHWMAEANEAASKGSWRDAVHLSYWAGISFLESQDLWRADAARTPREYLRLIKSSSEFCNSLFSLTRLFETVWYGYGKAGPDSFSEALKLLESMGCRPN